MHPVMIEMHQIRPRKHGIHVSQILLKKTKFPTTRLNIRKEGTMKVLAWMKRRLLGCIIVRGIIITPQRLWVNTIHLLRIMIITDIMVMIVTVRHPFHLTTMDQCPHLDMLHLKLHRNTRLTMAIRCPPCAREESQTTATHSSIQRMHSRLHIPHMNSPGMVTLIIPLLMIRGCIPDLELIGQWNLSKKKINGTLLSNAKCATMPSFQRLRNVPPTKKNVRKLLTRQDHGAHLPCHLRVLRRPKMEILAATTGTTRHLRQIERRQM
mmetsp:Transcript_10568/g.23067  ORF Transcript_10568/g.23067 Transcript_10568/m.23067 type:complete len:266 (+) Transcript_10568:676-1473(+)